MAHSSVRVGIDYAVDYDVSCITIMRKTSNGMRVEFAGEIRNFIYWLFNHRCVTCKRPAVEINHIIPRSRGDVYKDDWKNQIPQCSICHSLYHEDGVTQDKIWELQEARKNFLIGLGRSEFI